MTFDNLKGAEGNYRAFDQAGDFFGLILNGSPRENYTISSFCGQMFLAKEMPIPGTPISISPRKTAYLTGMYPGRPLAGGGFAGNDYEKRVASCIEFASHIGISQAANLYLDPAGFGVYLKNPDLEHSRFFAADYLFGTKNPVGKVVDRLSNDPLYIMASPEGFLYVVKLKSAWVTQGLTALTQTIENGVGNRPTSIVEISRENEALGEMDNFIVIGSLEGGKDPERLSLFKRKSDDTLELVAKSDIGAISSMTAFKKNGTQYLVVGKMGGDVVLYQVEDDWSLTTINEFNFGAMLPGFNDTLYYLEGNNANDGYLLVGAATNQYLFKLSFQ
jgi:hypothetical protein